jgi:hypothetical protein
VGHGNAVGLHEEGVGEVVVEVGVEGALKAVIGESGGEALVSTAIPPSGTASRLQLLHSLLSNGRGFGYPWRW